MRFRDNTDLNGRGSGEATRQLPEVREVVGVQEHLGFVQIVEHPLIYWERREITTTAVVLVVITGYSAAMSALMTEELPAGLNNWLSYNAVLGKGEPCGTPAAQAAAPACP